MGRYTDSEVIQTGPAAKRKRAILLHAPAMESYLTAEISASAVRSNLAILREHLTPPTRLCAVVKADCYGHGIATLLDVIAREADMLAVATPAEALELRRFGCDRPILMFFSTGTNGELAGVLEELVAREITLTVVAPEAVEAIASAARHAGRTARVHVKVDTGMTRSGVLPAAAPGLADRIRRTAGVVKLDGMYTHFAAADETDKSFTRGQLDRFGATVDACGGSGGLVLHAANSAATIDLPETHLDMVRCGIAMYGYQPSDEMHEKLPLQPALRLWGRVMQVKSVPAGSRCGYGLTRAVDRDSCVGLVPIGYGDGYFRSLSNRATFRVRGCDVPILGRVAMDQVIADLSDAPGAAVGDEVEILSSDPSAPHSVENLARLAGTIPYEVTCRLGRRIRRVLVE